MEFGLFVQAHVPRHEMEADPDNAEHSRLMRELELAEALRPPRLEIRVVGGASLPRGVLAHLGLGGLPALRRGTHRTHPRRLGHLQHHAAGEPSGAHGRARRHARPPERGPFRVRHRAGLVEHRVQGVRHPRRRHHAGDVRRVAARDPAHVEGDALQPSGQVLLDARAQRASQAVHAPAPASVGRVRQPVDLREGCSPRPRSAVLQPRLSEGFRAADQGLQGQHQARRAGRRLRQRQRRLRHRAGLPWRTARRPARWR